MGSGTPHPDSKKDGGVEGEEGEDGAGVKLPF